MSKIGQVMNQLKAYWFLVLLIFLNIPSLLTQVGETTLGLHSFHAIIVLVLFFGWGLIFLYQKSKLDFAYKTALIALGCGMLLIIVQPIMNGYDESQHLFKVIASLDGKGLIYSDYNYEISDSFFLLRGSHGNGWWGESYRVSWSQNTTMANALIDGRAQPTYPVWGYLFSMLGVGITRFFNAPLFLIYLSGKITNLLGFIFLGTWALKITPKLKELFAIFMCMPGTLFVACSYNADATTYGLIMLILAYFFKWWESESIATKEFIFCSALLFLVVPLKFPYIGLLGLLFLLPKQKFSFRYVNFWKIVLITLISIIALVWTTQISSHFVEWMSPGFNRDEQIDFIKHNFFQTIWIFVSSIFSQPSEFIDNFYCMSGLIGGNQPGLLKEAHVVFVFLILIISEQIDLKQWQKAWLFVITLGIWMLTDLALYVTFTPVGSLTMTGVQGRYLTPLLMLIALFIPKLKQNTLKTEQIENIVHYGNVIFSLMLSLGIAYYFYY